MIFLGITYDTEERYKEAEKIFRGVLDIVDPLNVKDYTNAYKRLAETLDHQKELSQALLEFDKYHEKLLEVEKLWEKK